jgi:hypothetical protein
MLNCMQITVTILLCLSILTGSLGLIAQSRHDSTSQMLSQVPGKYVSVVDKKITEYSNRVSRKTIRTIKKLSRWEEKIKESLQKVNPEIANNLFGNGQLTFSQLLRQIEQGEAVALDYRRQYDKYRDDVTTGFKYLETQKQLLDSGLSKKIENTRVRLQQLNNKEDSIQALQQFIKERKRQLVIAAFQYIGRSKYLVKMNKEVWYYAESMKNYKEILNDPGKVEQFAEKLLNGIPAFKNFLSKNSMLALSYSQSGDVAGIANSAGLQTRASVQTLIQERIAAGGEGALQQVQQNLQAAQAELNKLKDKLVNGIPGVGSGEGVMPDFKPNTQKTKTFRQRLEFGTDIQFARNNTLMPTTSSIALFIGFKMNDKSLIGVGGSYKLGLGTIDNIRLSHQGAGLRTFIDWKLKRQFFISGGYEWNYLLDATSKPVTDVYGNNTDVWQKSALLGISKKISINTKWFKNTKLQLLYDFLATQHSPVSQHWLFRVGYSF